MLSIEEEPFFYLGMAKQGVGEGIVGGFADTRGHERLNSFNGIPLSASSH